MDEITDDVIDVISSMVGLVYLAKAYQTHSDNTHYLELMNKMNNTLKKHGINPQQNLYENLTTDKGAEYLLHNLPHMQLLMDVAIGRAKIPKDQIITAIKSLKVPQNS